MSHSICEKNYISKPYLLLQKSATFEQFSCYSKYLSTLLLRFQEILKAFFDT
jgi:hypothetical protein